MPYNQEDLRNLLEDSGALLTGHFILSRGRHNDTYIEKFRLLEKPAALSQVIEGIAEFGRSVGANLVAGPTTGGILIALETARQMGTNALYVETEFGVKTLRRGATIPEGAKILVVDDVLTTGLSTRETVEALQSRGGEVVGVGVLISRSENPLDFGIPFFAAYTAQGRSWAPEEIPEFLKDIPAVKPGTRSSAK